MFLFSPQRLVSRHKEPVQHGHVFIYLWIFVCLLLTECTLTGQCPEFHYLALVHDSQAPRQPLHVRNEGCRNIEDPHNVSYSYTYNTDLYFLWTFKHDTWLDWDGPLCEKPFTVYHTDPLTFTDTHPCSMFGFLCFLLWQTKGFIL